MNGRFRLYVKCCKLYVYIHINFIYKIELLKTRDESAIENGLIQFLACPNSDSDVLGVDKSLRLLRKR